MEKTLESMTEEEWVANNDLSVQHPDKILSVRDKLVLIDCIAEYQSMIQGFLCIATRELADDDPIRIEKRAEGREVWNMPVLGLSHDELKALARKLSARLDEIMDGKV